MDKRFAVFLFIAIIVSIYEVVSNNQENGGDTSAEQQDSFKQFEEDEEGEQPAFKYTEEAQQLNGEEQQDQEGEEQDEVQIREPAGRGGVDKIRDKLKPPINMPPVRFAFCVSCGYRQAYEQFAQILRDKYPGIDLQGENYPPGLLRSLSAQVIGFSKIALIVCVVMGRDPFPALGMQTPTFFQWMLGNKMSSSILVFLFSNAVEGMLQSTGAFEIYIDSERIWSKMESGRVPSPAELFQAIDSHIAIRGGGGNKFTAGFGIDEAS